MTALQDLKPGLYQVALPNELQAVTVKVTLREDEHFWTETKNQKSNGNWVKTSVALHTSTAGLLLQANAIGVHVHSKVVDLERDRVRVVAHGYCLRADGMLEVVERSKEYDLNAELMKAALKEAKTQRDSGASEEQNAALAKLPTQETALALVSTLPPQTKARVMEAQLEVQSHREALCRTKAENQVLRHFIRGAGGVLKAKPGVGEVTVELTRYVLVRRLDMTEVRSAEEALYGRQPQQPPAQAEPDPPAPAVEDEQVLDGELVDRAEGDVAAEGAADTSPEEPTAVVDGHTREREADEATVTTPSEAPAAPQLSPKAQRIIDESRKLFTRPGAGGKPVRNNDAWRAWLMEKFGISGPDDLASFEDAACDASREADPWSE